MVILPEGGLDLNMYRALHDDLSIDDLANLEEIAEVARSHRDAAQANADAQAASQREKR